jgi:hypothetical protein
MNRPRILRRLLIAASVMCLIACTLLTAAWARSYRYVDILGTRMVSMHGRLEIWTPGVLSENTSRPIAEAGALESEWLQRTTPPTATGGGAPKIISVRYGPLAILFGVLAAAPWMSKRFSLRTLLLATTLVAAVLGLIVAFR